MPAGSKPGERRGGRQKGSPNTLPDLRALTLKALMQAGGVEYLTRQAAENPGPFLGLLGKVMPREVHAELTGELKIRAEVRRDLVEKVIVLMRVPEPQDTNDVIESKPLPAIAHTPDTMLKAARNAPRESLSRSKENARAEGAAITAGVMQRASAMHLERSGKGSKSGGYMEEAIARIDGTGAQGTQRRVAQGAPIPRASARDGAAGPDAADNAA
jgi:hypothetical protein